MSRWRLFFLWVAVCIAAFTLLAVFVLPPLARPLIEKNMSKVLHREVTIKGLAFNPYRLSVRARNLSVKDRPGPEPLFSCGEIYINLEVASLFKRAPVLSEIRLTRPYVRIVRFKDGSYNFSDLIEKKGPETPPMRFSISNIQIKDGGLDFLDEPEATKHEVRELELSIPFLSNISYYTRRYVQPNFSAKINGTPYTLHGKTRPFSGTHETYFDVAFTNLDLPRYLAYAPHKLGFKMPSGQMDARLSLSFSEPQGRQPAITLEGIISLKQIALDDTHNDAVLRLPRLDLSIASAEPLLKKFHLAEISLQAPVLGLSRNKYGLLNVEQMLPGKTAEKGQPKEETADAPLVQVDALTLTGGRITFQDSAPSTPFRTALYPVELKMSHFDTAGNAKASLNLSALTEAGEEITLDSELSLDPLSAEGAFGLKSLALGKYAPYYRERVLFDLVDGRLDLATRYRYSMTKKEPALTLSGLAASLHTLRLKKRGEKDDFLNIPAIEVKGGTIDLGKREISIGQIVTDNGRIRVRRDQSGQVNLLGLLAPPAKVAAPPAAPRAEPVKTAESDWIVILRQVSADGYGVTWEDLGPAQPVTINVAHLKLTGENISTAKKSRGKASLSMMLNGKGVVSASGIIGIDPLSAGLSVNLKNIDIGPFQPYFTDRVRLTVTGGDISTSGKLSIALNREKKLQAGFAGEIFVNRFASVDKDAAEAFLKWDSLALTGMNVAYNPTQVGIEGVSLTGFYARVLVNPDGTLNLSHIFQGQDEKPPAAEPRAATAPDTQETVTKTKIESLTLQGGEIDFADRSIEPHYSASLDEIGGRVSGLSSEESTTADVEVRGKLNDSAPLEITGKINPLKKDLFVDLKASFKDIDLSPTSPYSGKYAGYAVEKGKLSLDVKYHIVGKKLDSENRVTLDQFTFGERVSSPDATRLPVRLAVALLKDRSGVIDLDLPVTGSLDDPHFSIGRVILKIIVNLLTKAATSPFALLSAVFGHGEELSNLEFDYGSSAISGQGRQKLDAIIKALSDRPALKLEVEGFVDVEKDKEALKQAAFMRKLQAQKFGDLVRKREAPASVDQVTIEPGEYEKYLRMAYKAEKFPKPRNILGFAKELPAPEMEKLMLTHIVLTDDDLRALASQRAARVREAILKSGHVEGERVFLVEPNALAPEKQDGLKESRVAFKLR
jgi:uncharacterized protein involved in outer membrane biogenesis